MSDFSKDHQIVLGVLSTGGLHSSRQLQLATGKSQPSVSRLVADLAGRVLVLGRARATRYGLPKSIHGLSAQQALHWVDERGEMTRLGQVSLLVGNVLHVESTFGSEAYNEALPWFMTPLRAQGFLGRLHARHLASTGLGEDPDRWSLESVLFAALHLHDAPGALVLGEPAVQAPHLVLPQESGELAQKLDSLAADIAQTLPAGSSAGGEQPKLLAQDHAGRHVLVKFSPPLGTPFGDRWHDLLHTEALALRVLSDHGIAVAPCEVISTAERTYLISQRFDRVGARGRRHVVSVGAAHDAFVPLAYANWASTCEVLARQKRLPLAGAATAKLLLHFGRLIGNTDMHSGNLGLFVSLEGLSKGRFELAPAYDMLSMRFRPDAQLGGARDYAPFESDPLALSGPARPMALSFWSQLAELPPVSCELRLLAREMAARLLR